MLVCTVQVRSGLVHGKVDKIFHAKEMLLDIHNSQGGVINLTEIQGTAEADEYSGTTETEDLCLQEEVPSREACFEEVNRVKCTTNQNSVIN